MTTAQIIVLVIFGILTIIGYFGAAYRIDYKNHPEGLFYVILLTAISLLLLLLSWTITENNNQLEKQIKDKCPEYEKVENIYKLKEK